MKKLIVISCVVAIVAIACHRKAAPTVADRIEQPPPPPKQETPVVAVVAYDVADITAGKTVYEAKCTRCHTAKDVGNYTAERWPGILKSMVPRSKLTEIETKQVTAYVMTNAKKS